MAALTTAASGKAGAIDSLPVLWIEKGLTLRRGSALKPSGSMPRKGTVRLPSVGCLLSCVKLPAQREIEMAIKTLHYYRARWFSNTTETLENLIRRLWASGNTSADRTISLGSDTYMVGLEGRDLYPYGFAIHCAVYVDRQGIGVIPMTPSQTVVLGEQKPGNDENYFKSGFVALVNNNNVVGHGLRMNGASLIAFATGMCEKSSIDVGSGNFDLIRMANIETATLIERDRVKAIEFRSYISSLALDDIRTSSWTSSHLPIDQRIRNAILGSANALFGRDHQHAGIGDSERGWVAITVNVPSGDLRMATDSLDALAGEVVDGEDTENYIIHLRSGRTIKPHEVSLSKRVDIDSVANYLIVDNAFCALYDYMREL